MKEKEEKLKQNVYNNSAYARREIAVYIHTRTQHSLGPSLAWEHRGQRATKKFSLTSGESTFGVIWCCQKQKRRTENRIEFSENCCLLFSSEGTNSILTFPPTMLQIFLRECEMSRETGRSRERMGKGEQGEGFKDHFPTSPRCFCIGKQQHSWCQTRRSRSPHSKRPRKLCERHFYANICRFHVQQKIRQWQTSARFSSTHCRCDCGEIVHWAPDSRGDNARYPF